MQNRYIGDLGDFGKYGLLRAICAANEDGESNGLSLGVVWYLVPDESHNSDGRHTSYLDDSPSNNGTFRTCDDTLYDSLQQIVLHGERNVKSIQERCVLPSGTVYHELPLSFVRYGGTQLRPLEERVVLRDEWCRSAITCTSSCDVVFVDPDNGLEVRVNPHQRFGPKYVYFSDLLPYIERGQSLVIYHHIGRRGSAVDQIRARLAQIKQELSLEGFALRYHRGSARAFFIVPSDQHRDLIFRRAKRFVDGPWSSHFELISPNY